MSSQRIKINIQGTYQMGTILVTKLPSWGTKLSISFNPPSPTSIPSFLLQYPTILNILISVFFFITLTSFFVFFYHILYGFFMWVIDVRSSNNQFDTEEGRSTRASVYGHRRVGSNLTHQAAFYHVLVQYNVQVVNVLERFMRDEDERRGQRLRALRKLPPMVRYGSHNSCGQRLNCSTECAICLEDFCQGESCQVLPNCNHIFHTNCIDHWLKKKLTCPICRSCIL